MISTLSRAGCRHLTQLRHALLLLVRTYCSYKTHEHYILPPHIATTERKYALSPLSQQSCDTHCRNSLYRHCRFRATCGLCSSRSETHSCRQPGEPSPLHFPRPGRCSTGRSLELVSALFNLRGALSTIFPSGPPPLHTDARILLGSSGSDLN